MHAVLSAVLAPCRASSLASIPLVSMSPGALAPW